MYSVNNQHYLSISYLMMFATGLCRVSEIATGSHPILTNDIHVIETNKKSFHTQDF